MSERPPLRAAPLLAALPFLAAGVIIALAIKTWVVGVSVFVAINWGFTAATLLAAGCYAVASTHDAFGRWPEQPPTTQPRKTEAISAVG